MLFVTVSLRVSFSVGFEFCCVCVYVRVRGQFVLSTTVVGKNPEIENFFTSPVLVNRFLFLVDFFFSF